MRQQSRVDEALMVDVLIRGGELRYAVEEEHPAEDLRVHDVNPLIPGSTRIDDSLYADEPGETPLHDFMVEEALHGAPN